MKLAMPIDKLPYNHLVVHNIREAFTSSPKMNSCPMCSESLRVSTKCVCEVSNYAEAVAKICSNPFSEATTYCCDACGWFALREDVEDLECSAGIDHLVTSVLRVFDPWSKGEHSPQLRRRFEQGGRDLLWSPADELGEQIEQALRPKFSPCGVVHVGWRKAVSGERDDIYLVSDVTDAAWLLRVTRQHSDECVRFDSVWLLNGILFTDGEPSNMLVTIEDLEDEAPGTDERKNAEAPFLVEIANADALMKAFASEPARPADALLEHARRSPTIWKEWVPLPDCFFTESQELRRPAEKPRRHRGRRGRFLR